MPSVKIPRKSTATDMTPFVDVAFLILSFFMLATKFKPPEPIEIKTPQSVSSTKLKEQDALRVDMDPEGKVYLTLTVQKADDEHLKYDFIKSVNQSRNIGLSETEMRSFAKNPMVGVPFDQLKGFLATPESQRANLKQAGIPVLDSANNELATWIANAQSTFSGHKMNFLIKGDNGAKYPSFKGVIEALRRNEVFKYQLITDPEGVPIGSELYELRQSGKAAQES